MLTIERLEPVFDDFPVAALLLAPDGRFRILDANKACLNLLGRSHEALCGRPLLEIFQDDQPDQPDSPGSRAEQSIRRSIALREPQRDGSLNFLVTEQAGGAKRRSRTPEYIPVSDQHGHMVGVFGLLWESRTNHLTEEHNQLSAQYLRAIFDHTVEGFVLVNTGLEIMVANQKANQLIFQHSDGQAVKAGVSLLDYLPEERRPYFKAAAAKAMAGEPVSYESAYPDPDGDLRWYCFAINPVREQGDLIGLCISGRDITPQKLAEEKLSHNEKRFRGLVENSADAVAILAADGKAMYVSPAGRRITGYAEAETLRLAAFVTIHPENLPSARQIMATVRANPGLPICAQAIRIRHKDGGWRWIDATLTNRLDDPAIAGIIVNFRDVTARIARERQLLSARQETERSEENYRRLFNLSPLPKWIYDLQTLRILEVNEEAIRYYGYSRKEFLSMTIMDIRPPEDKDSLAAVLENLNGDPYKHFTYWRHLKKDGTVILVEVTGHAVDFAGRPARMIICSDITERLGYLAAIKEQNQQLREIAWSQSHTVRAPLARILGLANMARDPDHRESLPQILTYLQQSAEELDLIVRKTVSNINGIIPNDEPDL